MKPAAVQSGLYGTETNTVTKTLIYDSTHRLCRTTEPESGSTVMDYDGANNLAWSAAGLAITGSGCGREQVAAAAKTTRSYDAMNRVLTILPPAGTQSTVYTYDSLGHPTTAVSGISRWSDTYNDRGMPTGESLQVTGQGSWSLGYAHDTYGHLNTLRYPNNESVSYTPDALGRSTQAGGYASSVTYFPDGKERSYTLGNGMTALRDENTRQLLANLSYGLGANLRFSEDYHYDANGNLTSVVDLYNGQNDQTLGYDALNRLIAASAPNAWGTQTYAYDALNNLRQNVNGGYTINMNLDANNRLTSVTFGTAPFTTYQNDAHGNRSAMTYNGVTTPYSFDAKNQLLEVPGVARYAYDAAGRRIMKTPAVGGAAAATYSFYNQAGQLLYGYDAATAQGTNYIHLNGKLIARHKGTTTTYLLADRLGSPVREADASGNVTASFSYTPYGGLSSGPNQSQPGFTGHVNDPETAFTYMQQRYYDASVGRMLSGDPVGPTPGDVFNFNRYAYANDNPARYTDPDGRNATTALGGLIVESWNYLHGNGFNGSQVWGALKDGYNGEGSGFASAAFQDATSFIPVAKPLELAGGAIKAVRAGVQANRIAGKAAEALAAKELVAEGSTILGSQVGARTSDGLRVIDHLIQNPAGKMVAVEVKAGNGARSAAQLAKDGKMATEGAVLIGKHAPEELRGQRVIIETIERRYPNK